MVPNDSGFTPNGDLVLILPPETDEFSKGGIVLPKTVREATGRATRVGRVIDFGDQASEHPRMKGIERGTMVLFPRYAGDELPIDGQRYLILRAESIHGPITKLPEYEIGAAKSSMDAFGVNDKAA